jgi:hypothetical protein
MTRSGTTPGLITTKVGNLWEAQYTPGGSHVLLTAIPRWDAGGVGRVLFYEQVYRDVYDTAWAECRDNRIFESILIFAAFFVLGYMLMGVLCVYVL